MANHYDHFQSKAGEDEPIPVTAGNHQSLLRPTIPKGVTFNKKLIMGLAAVVGVICLLVMIKAFSPPVQKAAASSETGLSVSGTPSQASVNNSTLMAKELEKLADSYGHQNHGDLQGDQAAVFPGAEANPFFNEQASSTTSNTTQTGRTQIQEFNTQNSGIRFASIQDPNNAEQNNQNGKNAFFRANQSGTFYSAAQLQPVRSQYEVKATTIIPAVLITGIDSDLPGYITAQVRENVYDSVSGRYLLIPQGSRLMGLYDSKISYGQRRVMVVWSRMIFPNGASLDLEGIPGVDLSGYAGLTGKVNNHWGKLITGAVITSLFSVGTTKATNDGHVATESAEEIAGAAMAQNISQIGNDYVERNLNVQPTIRIKPGAKFNVFVVKDFILQPYSY